VIADAKRGDIDVSARAYAEGLLRAPIDALTVNPMLGADAVAPFIEVAREGGRGLFVLVRTSNPGAADFQDLELASGERWYQAVARQVAEWGAEGTGAAGISDIGAVVGATAPERIADLRALMPNQPFLIPGVGAQGGSAEELGAAFAGVPAGALVAASRSIIYADDPLAAALTLRDEVWAASRRSA
jgi:orotidine-5'-phosphate decarboxylase